MAEGFAMKTRLLSAAAALIVLFAVNEASATTYTIDIDYNPLDGTISPPSIGSGFVEYESTNIAVNLPTLFAGDQINTTINFTRGLALTVSGSGTQLFNGLFTNNSATGIVSNFSQLSLLRAKGDILTPDVVTGSSSCATCVGWGINAKFTDTSFSFRGFTVLTTILSIPQPFAPDEMHFQVFALPGTIDITHGASGVANPLPPALPLFATGLGASVPVPGPHAGAGIPGLVAGGVALLAWYRGRRKK
jgi:hypothetical protein